MRRLLLVARPPRYLIFHNSQLRAFSFLASSSPPHLLPSQRLLAPPIERAAVDPAPHRVATARQAPSRSFDHALHTANAS